MSFVVNDSCLESIPTAISQHDNWIIQQAIELLEQRVFKAGPCLDRPQSVKDYLRLKLVTEPNEVFAVMFMNEQHEVLAYEPMFRGTINAAAVYWLTTRWHRVRSSAPANKSIPTLLF